MKNVIHNLRRRAFPDFEWSVPFFWRLAKRYRNLLLFGGGFLFDVFTIERIDAIADILIQVAYLLGLTVLLVYQYRAHHALWEPGRWTAKIWRYNVEILHFLYGGLFSAYVILYFRSTAGVRALFFFVLLVLLLVVNEMPQIRRFGYRLRLGLYGFCVTSFMIYFVPILLGRMNAWVFMLSIIVSGVTVWLVAGRLVAKAPDRRAARRRLYLPAAALLISVVALYFMKLIPPVPLSVQYQGIFHHIEKTGDRYRLVYERPPFWAFWRHDSRPFLAREGDLVHYFARIFAPKRFKHEVMIRWAYWDASKEAFVTTDYSPMPIAGGRADGFRGYTLKANFHPGRWRVAAETKDGRIIGYTEFDIRRDESAEERIWEEGWM